MNLVSRKNITFFSEKEKLCSTKLNNILFEDVIFATSFELHNKLNVDRKFSVECQYRNEIDGPLLHILLHFANEGQKFKLKLWSISITNTTFITTVC